MSTYVSKYRASNPVKCSVCQENVKTPVQLPCKHKFCSKCVDYQISKLAIILNQHERVSIVCPYCREFFMSSLDSMSHVRRIQTPKTDKRKTDSKVQCCHPCAEGSHFETAVFWCKNCSEYMCSTCAKYHLTLKSSKEHIVQTIQDKERYGDVAPRTYDTESTTRGRGKLMKQVGIRRACEPCGSRRKRKDAEYFCDSCNELFCGECSLIHKSMKMAKSHEILSLRIILSSPEANNSLELRCEKHNNELLNLFCKRCQTSCCAICAFTTHSSCGEKFPSEDKLRKSIGVTDKKLSIQSNLDRSKADKSVSFETKQKPTSSEKNATKYTIARNKMEVRKGRIAIESNHANDWVISMAVLPNGDMLILQLYDSPLKMIDSIGNIVASITFNGHPWTVAAYNDSLAVVCFSDQKKLQLINISKGNLKPGNKIITRHKCISVCFSRHLLIATCWEGCVHVMNIAGEELCYQDKDNNGKKMFTNPEYITSDNKGNTVYISDYKRNSVTALKIYPHKIDNAPVFVFTDPELEGPKGVSVDRDGAIYVSGMASRNIFRISPEGEKIQVYWRRGDIDYYEDIAMSPTEDKLLVSAYEDDSIIVLRLQK